MRRFKKGAHLLAFLLPILLMGAVFVMIGFFPFGEKALLVIDMDNEYIDYFAQLNRVFREGGSLAHSFNMGMGLNMAGLIAFYTASPLNLIPILMPIAQITEAVLIMTLLKIGLAGFTFYLYSRYRFGEVNEIICVALSLGYALSGYNIVYTSNIMWLDGVIFLPLVLLGIEKILREDKPALFFASLIYVFITSYYIGYMIGIFSFLYFVAAYLADTKEGSFAKLKKKFAYFILSAGLAAGVCAFLLIPAYLNLKNGQQQLFSIPFSFNFGVSLFQLSSKLMPGSYDSLTDIGSPNIYCTVFAVFLMTLFFLNKKIESKTKKIFAAMGAFLLLSMCFDILNLAWHAFEPPTWFPARYSFVVCFFILYLSLRLISAAEGIKENLLKAVIISIAFFGMAAIFENKAYNPTSFIVAITFIVSYAVILKISATAGKKTIGIIYIAVLLLVATETSYNAYNVFKSIDKQFTYRNRDSYYSFKATYAPALEKLSEYDGGIYRTEILAQRNANSAMMLGYYGISHYSTTTDQKLNGFLKKLAYNTGTINELRFAKNTPVTNGLLGIKYVLSTKSMGEGYTLVEKVGNVSIWQNEHSYPLAFFAEKQTDDLSELDFDPFLNQNKLISSLVGEETDIFTPLPLNAKALVNIESAAGTFNTLYTRVLESEKATVEYILENTSGQQGYAFLPVYAYKYSKTYALTQNLESVRELSYRNNTVIALGNAEDTRVSYTVDGGYMNIAGEYFYSLDNEKSVEIAKKINENALDITQFSDNLIKGKITAPYDGSLVTTFPRDDGWQVIVDGKEIDTTNFAGVFLAFDIPQGEHDIVFKYHLPGFKSGIIISFISIILVAGYTFLAKRKKAN